MRLPEPLKKTIKGTLIVTLITFVLVEAILQLIYYIPAHSFFSEFVKESCRIRDSDLRIYFGKIMLPPKENKDVLTVGDSQTFGQFVASDNTFPALIERYTSAKTVNLGVPGTSPIFYNRMLEVGMRYDPKLVLYCIYANDFQESVYHYFPQSAATSLDNTGLEEINRHLFIERCNMAHKAIYVGKKIVNLSKSLQVTLNMVGNILVSSMFRSAFAPDMKHGDFSAVVEFEGHPTCFHPIFWKTILNLEDKRIRKGFHNALMMCKQAHDFSRSLDKNFLVVLIPCKEMICLHPPKTTVNHIEGMMNGSAVKNSDKYFRDPYDEFEKALIQQDIPVFNATTLFIEREREDKNRQLFFHTDSHLSDEGHRVMAEGIIQYLKLKRLWF